MQFLSDLPESMLQKIENEGMGGFSRSGLLSAAFDYAEKNNFSIEYLAQSPGVDVLGRADVVDGSIKIVCGDATSPLDFFECFGHETKHQNQARLLPKVFGWSKLIKDIKASRKDDVYALAESYALPSPANSALIRAVVELDAHVYGFAIRRDLKNIFEKAAACDQASINHAHKSIIEDAELIDEWVQQDIRSTFSAAGLLKILKDRHGKTPSIRWTPVSPQELQGAAAGMWGKAGGYQSPLAGREGQKFIEGLRQRIMNDPLCAETTSRMPGHRIS